MEEHDKLYDDALKRVSTLEGQLTNIEMGFENVAKSKNEIMSQQGQIEELSHDYYQGKQHDKYELLIS